MDWNSIFDDGQASSSAAIWMKMADNSMIDSRDIEYEGHMNKFDVKAGKIRERYFILTTDRLYYKKTKRSVDVKGYMECRFTRYISCLDVDKKTEKLEKLGIRFIKNGKYCDLYARNDEEWRQWTEKLSQNMIRCDFHRRFTVKQLIGEGAFAKVYLGLNLDDNKLYAVKVFSKEGLMRQRKGKAVMRNEIAILRDLSDINLMQLHEVHESRNSLYLVCEYLDGGSLSNYLNALESNLMTYDEVLNCILEILSGLSSLQEKDILHRDLKPENIMIKKRESAERETKQFKICDFGLATYANKGTYLYARCGTPGFVAPEVLKADTDDSSFRATSKCDTFSAGVILYLMLVGDIPFSGKNAKEILTNSAECKVNYNHERLENQPQEMLHLLRGLLASNPENRLSASTALKMPIFSRFRGTQLPVLTHDHLKYLADGISMMSDNDDPLSHSIPSLDRRSVIRDRKDKPANTSPDKSVFSIRLEDASSTMHLKSKPLDIRKFMLDMEPEKNKTDAGIFLPCLESINDSIIYSHDDSMISSMQSPKAHKPIDNDDKESLRNMFVPQEGFKSCIKLLKKCGSQDI